MSAFLKKNEVAVFKAVRATELVYKWENTETILHIDADELILVRNEQYITNTDLVSINSVQDGLLRNDEKELLMPIDEFIRQAEPVDDNKVFDFVEEKTKAVMLFYIARRVLHAKEELLLRNKKPKGVANWFWRNKSYFLLGFVLIPVPLLMVTVVPLFLDLVHTRPEKELFFIVAGIGIAFETFFLISFVIGTIVECCFNKQTKQIKLKFSKYQDALEDVRQNGTHISEELILAKLRNVGCPEEYLENLPRR